MDSVGASPYKPTSGRLRHAQSLDNVSWTSNSQKKQWANLDQNSRGKPMMANHMFDNGQMVGDDTMGSSESLYQSADFANDTGVRNRTSNDEFVSASVRPFNNNPPLPATQRDVVGNNLQFKSTPSKSDWLEQENDQLAALLLYRDALKRNLTTAARAGGGLPKMRHGRVGSQWRHIKQTNTYAGANLMFVDGTVRIDDTFKYPIPRFGYPLIKRSQNQFSSSQNDLTKISSQSLDAINWSANEQPRRRTSAAKENLNWLTDLHSNKPHFDQSFDETQFREVKEPTKDRTRNGFH